MKAQAQGSGLVTTATLVRGRIYVIAVAGQTAKTHYTRGKPVVVSDEVADELEEIVEVILDGDGEEFDKPYFKIERDVEPPADDEAHKRRRREPAAPPATPKKTIPVRPRRGQPPQ